MSFFRFSETKLSQAQPQSPQVSAKQSGSNNNAPSLIPQSTVLRRLGHGRAGPKPLTSRRSTKDHFRSLLGLRSPGTPDEESQPALLENLLQFANADASHSAQPAIHRTVKTKPRPLTVHLGPDTEFPPEPVLRKARFAHPSVGAIIPSPIYLPSARSASLLQPGSAKSYEAASILTNDFPNQVNPKRVYRQLTDRHEVQYKKSPGSFRGFMNRLDGHTFPSSAQCNAPDRLALPVPQAETRPTSSAASDVDLEVLVREHRLALLSLEGDAEAGVSSGPCEKDPDIDAGPFELPAARTPVLTSASLFAPFDFRIVEAAIVVADSVTPGYVVDDPTSASLIDHGKRLPVYVRASQVHYIPYRASEYASESQQDPPRRCSPGSAAFQLLKRLPNASADYHSRHYAHHDSCNFDIELADLDPSIQDGLADSTHVVHQELPQEQAELPIRNHSSVDATADAELDQKDENSVRSNQLPAAVIAAAESEESKRIHSHARREGVQQFKQSTRPVSLQMNQSYPMLTMRARHMRGSQSVTDLPLRRPLSQAVPSTIADGAKTRDLYGRLQSPRETAQNGNVNTDYTGKAVRRSKIGAVMSRLSILHE